MNTQAKPLCEIQWRHKAGLCSVMYQHLCKVRPDKRIVLGVQKEASWLGGEGWPGANRQIKVIQWRPDQDCTLVQQAGDGMVWNVWKVKEFHSQNFPLCTAALCLDGGDLWLRSFLRIFITHLIQQQLWHISTVNYRPAAMRPMFWWCWHQFLGGQSPSSALRLRLCRGWWGKWHKKWAKAKRPNQQQRSIWDREKEARPDLLLFTIPATLCVCFWSNRKFWTFLSNVYVGH